MVIKFHDIFALFSCTIRHNLGINNGFTDRGVEDPALWAHGVGNSWRTTDDINDTWARLEFLTEVNSD